MIDKYRPYILYTFISVVIVFVLMWVVDAFSAAITPAYQPFLQFLQIFKDILGMVMTQ